MESLGPAGIFSGTGSGDAEHPPGRAAAGSGKYVFYWQSSQCGHDSFYLADRLLQGLYHRPDSASGGILAGAAAAGSDDSGHCPGQYLLHGLGTRLSPQQDRRFCRTGP